MAILEKEIVEFNQQIVHEGFSAGKILCLSASPIKILMWSYYAQNHTGIVLRFKSKDTKSDFSLAKPVRYVGKMPFFFDTHRVSDFISGYGEPVLKEVAEDIVWTKSSHWRHEREWRIFAGFGTEGTTHDDVMFERDDLSAVIFGARISPTDIDELAQVVHHIYPRAKILKAKLSPDAYRLEISSI